VMTGVHGPIRWSRSRDYLPPTGPPGGSRQQAWYGRSRTPSPPSMKPQTASPGRPSRRQPPSALNLSQHHGPRKKVVVLLLNCLQWMLLTWEWIPNYRRIAVLNSLLDWSRAIESHCLYFI